MLDRLATIASTLLLSACSVVGVRSGTEEPRFDALGTEAGLEIRRYAPRLAAETTVAADEAAARNEGFSRLARYIFGANQGSATGSTHPDSVAEARARLLAALPATRWVAAGEPVAWFYDPPWTIPALRRNEVAVPVSPR